MANFGDIKIRYETRSCIVKGRPGLFHCWEHRSDVVDASPMIGGHPGGQISYVLGIVEFSDGVKRVDPTQIKFTDEDNAWLNDMEKHMKADRTCDKCKWQHTENCPKSSLCYDNEFKPYFVSKGENR